MKIYTEVSPREKYPQAAIPIKTKKPATAGITKRIFAVQEIK
jgi:hypothetical protein